MEPVRPVRQGIAGSDCFDDLLRVLAHSSVLVRFCVNRYIHELSLTLEHSMPISSPAALGLTVSLFSIFFFEITLLYIMMHTESLSTRLLRERNMELTI